MHFPRPVKLNASLMKVAPVAVRRHGRNRLPYWPTASKHALVQNFMQIQRVGICYIPRADAKNDTGHPAKQTVRSS